MKLTVVTPWQTACGISEFGRHLTEAIKGADPAIEIEIVSDLHPHALLYRPDAHLPKLILLNYHAALLSQWHPAHLQEARDRGSKVMVVWHDSGVPNSAQCKALHAVADAFVVHEPVEDLAGALYWRMGISELPLNSIRPVGFKQWAEQPVLGTIGFPFGWKVQIEAAKIAARAGWAFLCICPTADDSYVSALREANRHSYIRTDFVEHEEALSLLSGCDATSFCYVTNGAGQSGAITLGIAARKPTFALSTCRQMRSWYLDPLGRQAIRWCETFEEFYAGLIRVPLTTRSDALTVALAEQNGWSRWGERITALLKDRA